MKKISIGITLLALSGINVYLPNVGNLLDTWRIGFTLVAFIFGWFILMEGLAEWSD